MQLCRQVEKNTASCTACAKEPEARGRYLRIGAVQSALGERPAAANLVLEVPPGFPQGNA